MSKRTKQQIRKEEEDKKFPLPVYNEQNDIYNREKHTTLLDEDEERIKRAANELDVPGSELDDDNEIIGEEDEENNYYSLGGENHEDLEEDQA